MNEKFNKNAKVEKFTTMLGIAVRLIVIDPLVLISKEMPLNRLTQTIQSNYNVLVNCLKPYTCIYPNRNNKLRQRPFFFLVAYLLFYNQSLLTHTLNKSSKWYIVYTCRVFQKKV